MAALSAGHFKILKDGPIAFQTTLMPWIVWDWMQTISGSGQTMIALKGRSPFATVLSWWMSARFQTPSMWSPLTRAISLTTTVGLMQRPKHFVKIRDLHWYETTWNTVAEVKSASMFINLCPGRDYQC